MHSRQAVPQVPTQTAPQPTAATTQAAFLYQGQSEGLTPASQLVPGPLTRLIARDWIGSIIGISSCLLLLNYHDAQISRQRRSQIARNAVGSVTQAPKHSWQ